MAEGMRILAAVALAALALASVLCPFQADAADPGDEGPDSLLVDFGDGTYEWFEASGGSTVREMLEATLGEDVSFEERGGEVRVSEVLGRSCTVVGTQECSWRVYIWNSVSWEFLTEDASDRFKGGDAALGFYPADSIAPASNPDNREVWTSYRGNSSSTGVSVQTAPAAAATPLEWVSEYSGAVDCNILYADGLIYHTVSGRYGSVGMDSVARVYCLDPVNREVAWCTGLPASGTAEVATPVIVGDMIVVPSGSWHMYCLDRFTGEPIAELMPEGAKAAMCSGSRVAEYETFKDSPKVAYDRLHLETGVSNAVYDSGALYFCTSDGAVRCYSISREAGFQELWTHVPDDEHRGCIYYHPPVVVDCGGRGLVLTGNCAGSLLCLDASTGESVWSLHVVDSAGEGTSFVGAVVPCDGGRALVCATGPEGGCILLVDVATGEAEWTADIRCSKPVAYGDRFYAYVSQTSAGAQTLTDSRTGAEIPVVNGYYSFWVSDCGVVWVQDSDAINSGGLTYCDGRLYSIDYSPGTEGANGGFVWCLDSDTGSVVWKVKLQPSSGLAYSMCTPSVVDGKVLVGNDFGAVYVISEKPGVDRQRTGDIDYASQGFAHWSWVATAAASLIILAVAAAGYRRC